MPGQKGKQSARRFIDNCGSTNPRTIARHKRDWRSSVKVKPTKYTARMAPLSSQACGLLQDIGGPSNLVELAAIMNPAADLRVTGQLVFTDLQALANRAQAYRSTINQRTTLSGTYLIVPSTKTSSRNRLWSITGPRAINISSTLVTSPLASHLMV
jgi:hypothetical protein